jgi:hypothetical protein
MTGATSSSQPILISPRPSSTRPTPCRKSNLRNRASAFPILSCIMTWLSCSLAPTDKVALSLQCSVLRPHHSFRLRRYRLLVSQSFAHNIPNLHQSPRDTCTPATHSSPRRLRCLSPTCHSAMSLATMAAIVRPATISTPGKRSTP